MGVEGRTNVVVGAASGMGAATARLLAGRGRLVIADREPDGLETVAASLDGEVETVVCDVTSGADVDGLVATVGALGALVVAAGLSPTMAPGRPVYEVNLRGAERVLQGFGPSVGPGSAAVVLASMAAHLMTPDPAIDAILDAPFADDFYDRLDAAGLDPDESAFAYALSKRGVVLMVRRHALDWGPRGGRVVSISPGIIDTPMGRLENENQPAMLALLESSALARMGDAEEVARVAAFLVSADASFVTGTDVLVDGGCVAATQVAS